MKKLIFMLIGCFCGYSVNAFELNKYPARDEYNNSLSQMEVVEDVHRLNSAQLATYPLVIVLQTAIVTRDSGAVINMPVCHGVIVDGNQDRVNLIMPSACVTPLLNQNDQNQNNLYITFRDTTRGRHAIPPSTGDIGLKLKVENRYRKSMLVRVELERSKLGSLVANLPAIPMMATDNELNLYGAPWVIPQSRRREVYFTST